MQWDATKLIGLKQTAAWQAFTNTWTITSRQAADRADRLMTISEYVHGVRKNVASAPIKELPFSPGNTAVFENVCDERGKTSA